MILIGDGGSTKTDWRLIDKGLEMERINTRGINPYFCSFEEISREIELSLKPKIDNYIIESVSFYGAGCNTEDKKDLLIKAIAQNLNVSSIEVDSDLMAAARGLCGKTAGIACIVGTGSNSCLYDGMDIIEHISPLGYILGDEGSGAVLGRLLVNACLKNQLNENIKEAFLKRYDLTPTLILDKVYRQPMPNRFLAGFTPFILENINDKKIYKLVYNSFKDFFIKNVMQYNGWEQHKVHFTGSVAFYFRDILKQVANELGINIGTIEQSPMNGLINYYTQL
jgi:N-acetylglucosamine kinase-like BadF-type ATPase